MLRLHQNLVVMGAVNWDVTLFVDRFAAPGEEVPVTKVLGFPGGKGANVAVAAARILGRGSVGFIGAVGHDVQGSELARSLRAEGVDVGGLQTIDGVRSGHAYVIVDSKGGKEIHTHFGANASLRPSHVLSGQADELLKHADNLVVMDVPIKVVEAVARLAAEGKKKLTYSPGVFTAKGLKAIAKVLGLSHSLVLDRRELSALSGDEDPKDGAMRLRDKFPDLVVVGTLGSVGCLVSTEKGISFVPPVDLAPMGLKAVNSTGSGDAFLAAFVCYGMFGASFVDCAKWGNLAGALKAATPETRGSPTRELLELRMSQLTTARPRIRGSPSNRASGPSHRRS